MDIKKIIANINNSLLNDDFRQSFILVTTSALLSIICMISCIPHFIDDPSPKIMAIILVITAACSLSILPPLILYIICNKRMLTNVSIGGIKD